MGLQVGQGLQHAGPVALTLAHADDAARADIDPRLTHPVQGLQPVGVGVGGDDLAVVLRRGVHIVVVVIEAGVL